MLLSPNSFYVVFYRQEGRGGEGKQKWNQEGFVPGAAKLVTSGRWSLLEKNITPASLCGRYIVIFLFS